MGALISSHRLYSANSQSDSINQGVRLTTIQSWYKIFTVGLRNKDLIFEVSLRLCTIIGKQTSVQTEEMRNKAEEW